MNPGSSCSSCSGWKGSTSTTLRNAVRGRPAGAAAVGDRARRADRPLHSRRDRRRRRTRSRTGPAAGRRPRLPEARCRPADVRPRRPRRRATLPPVHGRRTRFRQPPGRHPAGGQQRRPHRPGPRGDRRQRNHRPELGRVHRRDQPAHRRPGTAAPRRGGGQLGTARPLPRPPQQRHRRGLQTRLVRWRQGNRDLGLLRRPRRLHPSR